MCVCIRVRYCLFSRDWKMMSVYLNGLNEAIDVYSRSEIQCQKLCSGFNGTRTIH